MGPLRATNKVGSNQSCRISISMEEAGLNLKDTTRTDHRAKWPNQMFCGHEELTRAKTRCSETIIKAGTVNQVLREWLDRIETKLDMCHPNSKTNQATALAVWEKARRFSSRTIPTKTWRPKTITSNSSRTKISVDSNLCTHPAEEAR